MNKLLLSLVLLFFSIPTFSQEIGVGIDDRYLDEYNLRYIRTKLNLNKNEIEVKYKGNCVSWVTAYPGLSLEINDKNPKRIVNKWFFTLRLFSNGTLGYTKGARCILKTQKGEVITLKTDDAEYDRVGDYYGNSLWYTVFPQFYINKATLDKLSNNVITKIRFELLPETIEGNYPINFEPNHRLVPLNLFIKTAKERILEQKNKTKDKLYDDF